MPLSDLKVRKLKPKDKPYKISDMEALYILVNPSGSKLWKMDYSFEGKRKTMSFGKYPAVTLKKARQRKDEARELLADGIDPMVKKKEELQKVVEKTVNTFENIAREWYDTYRAKWSEKHAVRILARLENHLFPTIGHLPIKEVTTKDLRSLIDIISNSDLKSNTRKNTNKAPTIKRALQHCSNVFLYAIQTERADYDITVNVKGLTPPHKEKHHASITTPKEIGEFLRKADDFKDNTLISILLRLTPLVFVRPTELREASWEEFDFDDNLWRIPEERMKMGRPHIVPLATQTLKLLNELKQHTGNSEFLFPSDRAKSGVISDTILRMTIINKLGYHQGTVTPHGFRSTATTLLNELGFNADAIERQLAHGERNSVRAAYNYAQYLPQRREMMQHWADYLDNLKSND